MIAIFETFPTQVHSRSTKTHISKHTKDLSNTTNQIIRFPSLVTPRDNPWAKKRSMPRTSSKLFQIFMHSS